MRIFGDLSSVKLDNGVTVINDYMPDAYAMGVTLTAHVGTAMDPADKYGLAHLAEHLVLSGAPERSSDDLTRQLAGYGMLRESGLYNLVTADRYSSYYAAGPREGALLYLDHIASALQHRAYRQSDLATEKGRIVNETTNAMRTLYRIDGHLMFRASFGDDRPLTSFSGGDPAHFPSMTLDDVRGYHRATHFCDNLVLLVSGPWTHQEAQDWAYNKLSGLGRGHRFPSPQAIYRPNDIAIEGLTSDSHTRAAIMLNMGRATPKNDAAFALVKSMLSSDLKQAADRHGLYATKTLTATHSGVTQLAYQAETDPAIMQPLLRDVVGIIRNSRNTLGARRFDELRGALVMSDKLDRGLRGGDVRYRAGLMAETHIAGYDPAEAGRGIERLEALKLDDVHAVLDNMFAARPATVYTGVLTDGLPDGADITDRLNFDMSGRNAKPRSAFKAGAAGPRV